jgi:hypothetical protein
VEQRDAPMPEVVVRIADDTIYRVVWQLTQADKTVAK